MPPRISMERRSSRAVRYGKAENALSSIAECSGCVSTLVGFGVKSEACDPVPRFTWTSQAPSRGGPPITAYRCLRLSKCRHVKVRCLSRARSGLLDTTAPPSLPLCSRFGSEVVQDGVPEQPPIAGLRDRLDRIALFRHRSRRPSSHHDAADRPDSGDQGHSTRARSALGFTEACGWTVRARRSLSSPKRAFPEERV